MPKLKSVYRCQQCGYTSPKWFGQCADCEAWNSLVEEVADVSPVSSGGRKTASILTAFSSEVTLLSEVGKQPQEKRLASGIGELDQILGGGLIPGQIVLLAGPPGIGKSTLMLQAAGKLAHCAEAGKDFKVLYVSGEESLNQVAGRAKRLGIQSERIYIVSETNLARVLETMENVRPSVLILDSIQTVYHQDLAGSPGSVGQVRECAGEILRAAKSKGIITFLLGHVTKEGSLAGPKVLEHIVDTVLYFDAEEHELLRILRAHKNRFGPSSEIGIFEMREEGLRELPDASAFFISERAQGDLPGRAISVVIEGTRPLLVEVQALVAPTRYPLPRRMATGLDQNRTMVLIAALEKHLHLHLENQDVFVSLTGGMRQKDPALDLAICMALISSARDISLPADCAFVGEVGLLGQLNRVALMPQRLKELKRLGFRRAFVPKSSLKDLNSMGSLALQGFDAVAACAAQWTTGGASRHKGPEERVL